MENKILAEKFIPVKCESWRFSGFKGLSEAQCSVAAKFSVYPQEIIIADGKMQKIVERLQGENDPVSFNKRLIVRRNSTLDFVLLNELSENISNFNFLEVIAYENAKVNLTIINRGSSYTRQEITAFMRGAGANVRLCSLSFAKDNMEIDQRTWQIHEAPGAKSDLLFKNVLAGRARTIFSGMIKVAPGAQKTDAYQKNQNLLLSEAAEANSLPGLEIEADDVRCSHGAACGSLNAEELFYLRSRGIPEAQAKQMLVGGFCEEIFGGVPEEIAAPIRKSLEMQ